MPIGIKLVKTTLAGLMYNFSIICFSDTWLNDLHSCNQDHELPNYKRIHQIKNHGTGESLNVNKYKF